MTGLSLFVEASNDGEWIREELNGQRLRWLVVLIGK